MQEPFSSDVPVLPFMIVKLNCYLGLLYFIITIVVFFLNAKLNYLYLVDTQLDVGVNA